MKRIIFFDGDGTIWYPATTRRAHKPHWVYKVHADCRPHLVITPTTRSTLRALRRMGVRTVLLSTHPHAAREATRVLRDKVAHFKLGGLFDDLCPTRPKPGSKTTHIRRLLSRYGIPKGQALMVGDSYKWDYRPAKRAGIDALLIESAYRHTDPGARRIRRVIRDTREVLQYV
jgi:FMN phosphatase YigB (HAD superfamily)